MKHCRLQCSTFISTLSALPRERFLKQLVKQNISETGQSVLTTESIKKMVVRIYKTFIRHPQPQTTQHVVLWQILYFCSQDGESRFLLNVSNHLPDCTVSEAGRSGHKILLLYKFKMSLLFQFHSLRSAIAHYLAVSYSRVVKCVRRL
jgi:hypothetical protein